ncbi:MAG: PilT/PilU family type 4a pilus ATPase [Chloroflexi bacterium]|nr:PilT/PilU family type 4a pilus ATPase [Chloroflexota bacterium]
MGEGPFPQLLRRLIEAGGSDLHLAAGSPPVLRVHGELEPVAEAPNLTGAETQAFLHALVDSDALQTFARARELDFPLSVPGLGRFRVNACIQRGTVALSIRPVPFAVPSLRELNLPPVCATLVTRHHGLVVVTGATGSGKSTTLAAMLDHLNSVEPRRIITLEDPIEFLHQNKRSMIIQREVGGDTVSFSIGVKQALRQDPDVVLVGEARDRETLERALSAAETGHLILTSLHSGGAVEAIQRMIDMFPPEQQHQARFQLGMVLEGIIYQVLLPRSQGPGRVAAFEVLLGTNAIRNLIRRDQLSQVRTYVQTGGAMGMQTLEQSLAALVRQGIVREADARTKLASPEALDQFLKGQAPGPANA